MIIYKKHTRKTFSLASFLILTGPEIPSITIKPGPEHPFLGSDSTEPRKATVFDVLKFSVGKYFLVSVQNVLN